MLQHNSTHTNRNHATVIILFATTTYAESVMDGAQLIRGMKNIASLVKMGFCPIVSTR